MNEALLPRQHRAFNANVPLWPDEPAYALANRLARRNGVNSLASFGGDHGIPFREIVNGHRNAEIAQFAGADVAKLDAVTFRSGDDERVRLNGEVLHQDDWSYVSLRVCPTCLKDDLERQDSRISFLPHVRSWWNVVRISVCPIHGVALVESDPTNTSMKVDHERLDVRYAAGRQCDLAKVTPEKVGDVQVETYLLGRLGFMPRVTSSILDTLPLWNAIRLMDRIGAVAAAGVRGFTSFGGEVAPREALVAGYAVFAGGREGFIALLDRLVASADIRQGKWGPRVVYGRVYEWLSHDTRDTAYDSIRELVREHALDNLPLAPEDLVFGRPVGERRIYTLWHAARAIETGPSAAGRIFRAMGHLDVGDVGKANWQITLKASVVKKVCLEIGDKMSFNGAMAYLGLPRGPMHALFDEGILRPFLHVSDGVSEHMFRKRDLDAFIAELAADAPKSGRCDELCDVVLAGKRSQTSTSLIVKALQTRRLHCRGVLNSAVGLMKILVNLAEVNAFRDANAGVEKGRSVDWCRERLGVTWPVFNSLIEMGFIRVSESTTGFRNRKIALVEQNSLEEFERRYISATQVAAARNTHVRTLVPALRSVGIGPAIEKEDAGQYFYRRSDVSA
jgi:hypothetical protein